MTVAFATVKRWHTPPLQGPPRHPCPHDPQLAASLACVFVHTPLQFVWPAGHAHTPLVHDPPVGHACPVPHAPQYVVDVLRLVSQPFAALLSQLPKPVLHDERVQAPLVHAGFAFAIEHAEHTAPLVPQLVADSLATASHVPALQHPVQEVPPQLQAPALHAWPPAHIPHAPPPEPHIVVDWFAVSTHVSPEQQPFGHDAGVQVHAPAALQAWLAPQAAHAAPPTPHFVASSIA